MASIKEKTYIDEKIDYTDYIERKKENRRTREETISILKRMADSYEKDAEEFKYDTFQSMVFQASANAYRKAAQMIEFEMK